MHTTVRSIFRAEKYTKTSGGRGFAPDPTGGAHNAPPDPLAINIWGSAPYPAGGAPGAPPDPLPDFVVPGLQPPPKILFLVSPLADTLCVPRELGLLETQIMQLTNICNVVIWDAVITNLMTHRLLLNSVCLALVVYYFLCYVVCELK
jgi:hypothetical protein